jgi:glutathione peroxidase
MKILLIAALVAACGAAAAWFLSRGGSRPADARSRASLYDYAYTSIEGTRVPLSDYRGKYLLFVNVASQCGFTPQYAELEKLSSRYKDDLVVLGFPANDFLGQEPGTNDEIKTFCTVRYGVTFPLSQKVSVVGDGRCDIYRWLTDKELNGWNNTSPKWNFYKYLVGRDGELLKVFPSSTTPLDPELTGALR